MVALYTSVVGQEPRSRVSPTYDALACPSGASTMETSVASVRETMSEREMSTEEKKKRSSTRRLLNAKKRMSGYRLRAIKAGSEKNILGRLYSTEDIRRMGKFVPNSSTLSYTEQEFHDRATLSVTPFPASAAFALGPSVDALARHIVNTASVASYTAGRSSCTPWDILCASRGVLQCLDYTAAFPEGVIEYGQTHDNRGDKIAGRHASENARLPMIPFGDDDVDIEDRRCAMKDAYSKTMEKVSKKKCNAPVQDSHESK